MTEVLILRMSLPVKGVKHSHALVQLYSSYVAQVGAEREGRLGAVFILAVLTYEKC